MNAWKKVPSPMRLPWIGNVPQFFLQETFATLNRLAHQFDGIYEIRFPGECFYVVSRHDFVAELCDTKRFSKTVDSALREIRELTGDGLFTAHTEEPHWETAHSILAPGFSMKSMKDYVPIMQAVARELCAKWHQQSESLVSIPDDMTRYTLETIGRCGFDYSFESFSRKDLDPFIDAMNRSLAFAIKRGRLLPFQRKLTVFANARFDDDRNYMNHMVDKLIQERKNGPSGEERSDLLHRMLQGADRQTGRHLDEKNIRYQLITFLIAGHETTSGLLSFALYFLVKHPEVMAKARAEVEDLLGKDPDVEIHMGDIAKLRYVSQVLRESLRLYPTAPGFFVASPHAEVLANEYRLEPGRSCFILLHELHRDPKVWGPDAERFDPDRFAPERIQSVPTTAFRPFGNGPRSCIGQNFAMVEATILLALILQQFDLIDATRYQLKIKETMTIKPDEFYLQVRSRVSRSKQGAA